MFYDICDHFDTIQALNARRDGQNWYITISRSAFCRILTRDKNLKTIVSTFETRMEDSVRHASYLFRMRTIADDKE